LTAALSVVAHAAAGGGLPSGSMVAVLAVLSATLGMLVATIRDTANVKVLVAVLAVGQLLCHAVLGAAGHSHSSAGAAPLVLMVSGHALAIAIGATLIAMGGHLCAAASRVLRAASARPHQLVTSPSTVLAGSADQPRHSALILAASVSHRGPPVSLAP
jgi:hypothetical protein